MTEYKDDSNIIAFILFVGLTAGAILATLLYQVWERGIPVIQPSVPEPAQVVFEEREYV
jgi:hypothetical protein